MARLNNAYDPDAKPSSGYTPLPLDDYTLEIVESSYDANNDGDGMVLALKTQIVGGEFDQRPYFIWMDLENDDPKKQERGQRDFAGLRRATGVLNPQDTEELHFKPFKVTIGTYVQKTTGDLKNTIKKYHFDSDANSSAPAAANNNGPAAQQQRPAAASGGSKPWRK
ncbi:DUF669 domain-containing protein [Bosea thiooxidans]